MNITHTLMDPEAQSMFCACITVIITIIHLTDTNRTEKAIISPKHQQPMSQVQQCKKKIRQTNCAQASLQQRGLNERAFGSTHLAPG